MSVDHLTHLLLDVSYSLKGVGGVVREYGSALHGVNINVVGAILGSIEHAVVFDSIVSEGDAVVVEYLKGISS